VGNVFLRVQEGKITGQNDGWSEKRMHDKAGNMEQLYFKVTVSRD
jgi:hypothetical protein